MEMFKFGILKNGVEKSVIIWAETPSEAARKMILRYKEYTWWTEEG